LRQFSSFPQKAVRFLGLIVSFGMLVTSVVYVNTIIRDLGVIVVWSGIAPNRERRATWAFAIIAYAKQDKI
jgi:hypothetical protein